MVTKRPPHEPGALRDELQPAAAGALEIIWSGFEAYTTAFSAITGRARERFERRDWENLHHDTVERIDLYPRLVQSTLAALHDQLGPRARDEELWASLKTEFRKQCRARCDAELAFTFYNSVNRKMFDSAGIRPWMEFVSPPSPLAQPHLDSFLFISISAPRVDEWLVRDILLSYGIAIPFADLHGDARICAQRIRRHGAHRSQSHSDSDSQSHARSHSHPHSPAYPDPHHPSQQDSDQDPHPRQMRAPVRIDMIKYPFYRDMGLYLIGRVTTAQTSHPLVFALHNGPEGVFVDALLLTQDQLRILFSFSRAYFHVPAPAPGRIVAFLKELMPGKRIAEIYIALGHHKHGKTELYSDLLDYQQTCSQEQFEPAPGQRGMVMIAFNMPNDDLMYKLFRDRFAAPKRTNRKQVMERYDYVFKHDRAGRLLDVQTFENLQLAECRFSPDLLAEIREQAKETVTVDGDQVVLRHVYVERRVTPLDIYLQQAGAEDARAVVIDYGNAIKDLARIDVFPGDMLLKNFGVTSLRRIVFYDYDELCALMDCNFRRMPKARRYEDEVAGEPWFAVAENDVFPEEFGRFLGLNEELREIFIRYHGDLLEPEFWWHAQERIRAGEWSPILPYTQSQRLRPTLPDSDLPS